MNLKIINNNRLTRSEKEAILEDVYNKYKDLIFYIIYHSVINYEDAKELVNDVFLAFFNHLDEIDLNKNIKYYLVTSAKNASLNHLKKKKENIIYDQELIYKSQDNNKSWNDIVEYFKEILSEDELNICVMKLIYNYKFIDIAKEENISINTITSKYYRALEKIKKYYEEKAEWKEI